MLEAQADAAAGTLRVGSRRQRSRWPVFGAIAATAVLGGTALAGTASASAPAASPLSTVATGLNNPRHMIFRDGKLFVAEAGVGGNGACATGEEGTECVGRSGDVAVVGVAGTISRIMKGMSSVAPSSGAAAGGPADVTFSGVNPVAIVQDSSIDKQGRNPFGAAGNDLGKLVVGLRGGTGPNVPGPDFAKYEAMHNPDHGAPTSGPGSEPPIDSDPYGITAYRGGFAVADAAGNDILWVNPQGVISVLAVIPTNTVTVPPGTPGAPPGSKAQIQAVPTSVRVGPDGALYVSELSGVGGSAKVLRIVPGHAPTVYAKGFDSLSDIAFDSKGRLLALTLQQGGLFGPPAPGLLTRVNADGSRTVLTNKLSAPTGLAVDGNRVFISNNGASPAGGAQGGQIVSLVENN